MATVCIAHENWCRFSAGGDGVAPGPQHVVQRVDLDGWREGVFQVCWRRHSGSGMGLNIAEVLEMPTSDRDRLLERIERRRSREAKEIEKAEKRR